MNKENVQKLRDYYAALPELRGWSYDECAAGVLAKMGITTSVGDWAIANALGIATDQAQDIVAGPRTLVWSGLTEVSKRDLVVAMFDRLLATGDVNWGVPK